MYHKITKILNINFNHYGWVKYITFLKMDIERKIGKKETSKKKKNLIIIIYYNINKN